jgi:hypothetical protein
LPHPVLRHLILASVSGRQPVASRKTSLFILSSPPPRL